MFAFRFETPVPAHTRAARRKSLFPFLTANLDFLTRLLDHADFLEYIRAYARTHPASRTTTELLFLMDELAQASREAAVGVLTTEISRDLLRTAVESPPAARLAAAVAQQLRDWLIAHGLRPSELREAFDRTRLRLLATIVETSPDGYRVADARYLAGEIFFRQGDLTQAIEWWQVMRPAAGDSYATRALADAAKAADVDAIKRVLSPATRTERAGTKSPLKVSNHS